MADRVIGVISDTHGLLRPEAIAALQGSELIVHAGDIGSAGILLALGEIAPVVAVRGNNDRDDWAQTLPDTQRFQVDDVRMLVVHDVHTLPPDEVNGNVDVIISGHSHRPRCEHEGDVLYFNPGAAGPRRFKLPVCVGRLMVSGRTFRGDWITLDV